MSLSVKLTIRMTEDAKALLDKKASELKINPSKFVRLATDHYEPKSLPVQQPKVNWDTYHLLGQLKFELRKIRKDLNQLSQDILLSVESPTQHQLDGLLDLSNRINEAINLIFDANAQIVGTAGLTNNKEEEEDDWENK